MVPTRHAPKTLKTFQTIERGHLKHLKHLRAKKHLQASTNTYKHSGAPTAQAPTSTCKHLQAPTTYKHLYKRPGAQTHELPTNVLNTLTNTDNNLEAPTSIYEHLTYCINKHKTHNVQR